VGDQIPNRIRMSVKAAVVPGWAERAYQAIVAVARFRPTVHVDDVLLIFTEEPKHPNAWGLVWVRALRDRVISRTETMRETRDRRKHRHRYPVYASKLFGRRSVVERT
jgi:hypothetical protein